MPSSLEQLGKQSVCSAMHFQYLIYVTSILDRCFLFSVSASVFDVVHWTVNVVQSCLVESMHTAVGLARSSCLHRLLLQSFSKFLIMVMNTMAFIIQLKLDVLVPV